MSCFWLSARIATTLKTGALTTFLALHTRSAIASRYSPKTSNLASERVRQASSST
jgi:hypothetical protein